MAVPTSELSGSALITADGVLGTADAPTRVFNIHIISGGTAGVVSLNSGDEVGDTAHITETGTASTGATFDYGTKGQVFAIGVFVNVDANVTSVKIAYSQ